MHDSLFWLGFGKQQLALQTGNVGSQAGRQAGRRAYVFTDDSSAEICPCCWQQHLLFLGQQPLLSQACAQGTSCQLLSTGFWGTPGVNFTLKLVVVLPAAFAQQDAEWMVYVLTSGLAAGCAAAVCEGALLAKGEIGRNRHLDLRGFQLLLRVCKVFDGGMVKPQVSRALRTKQAQA